MCAVERVIPLPKCAGCVEVELAELKPLLLVTPDHPVLVARVEQLNEDGFLTDEAFAAAEDAYLDACRSGDGIREQVLEVSRLDMKRSERSRLAKSVDERMNVTDLSGWGADILLSYWAVHPNPVVRSRVASNPTAPVEVLELLARDFNADVLTAVMSNPSRSLLAYMRVAGNPHLVVNGMAHVLCLMEGLIEPDRAEFERAVEGLSLDEKLRFIVRQGD